MEEHGKGDNLKAKTTQGIVWSFFDKFGQQFLYLLSGVLLARMVSPGSFGMIAVLSVFTVVSDTLVDCGFNRGLLNRKRVTQDEYNTVFYFNLIVSLLLYGLLYLVAPFIASYFDNGRLVVLSRVVFLSIPFNALASIQNVLLWKRIDLKEQAYSTLIALSCSTAIALLVAFLGGEVWALVAQPVLLSLVKSIVLWKRSHWRPTRTFRLSLLKGLFPFGSKLLLTGVINGLFNKIYLIVIGRIFSLQQVGYYNQALKYQEMATGSICNVFRSVSISVLAEVNEDNGRMWRVMSKMIKSIAFLVSPLTLLLILLGHPLLVWLLSDVWAPSVPLFKVLCVAGFFNAFNFIFNEAVVSKGRSDIFMNVEIAKRVVLLLMIGLTIPYGVLGLAYSWMFYSFFSLCVTLYFSGRLIGYGAHSFVKDISAYLLISVGITLPGYYLCKDFVNGRPVALFDIGVGGAVETGIVLLLFAGVYLLLYLLLCALLRLEIVGEIFQWARCFKQRKR